MPVYGSLLSTWPAASGILVQDGVAYLAAGIVNYDGTYVYALDAATGHIKWQNNTSGHLEPDARTGVSVQGHMLIHDGKLYLAGGNAVSPAIYDLTDGKCLNDAAQLRDCVSVYPRGWELFLIGDKIVVSGKPFYTDPRYPVFDKTVTEKLLHASNGHKDIVWQNNRELMCFAPIDRQLLSNCVTPPPRRARGAPGSAVVDPAVQRQRRPGPVPQCRGGRQAIRARGPEYRGRQSPLGAPLARSTSALGPGR